MGPLPVADVIELEQLLARYAVGMTKDDVESVMEVFTPDGTYSAFGDTYRLVDFPALVAAAPKGLFLVGPPALELDGDDRHRASSRCASSSRRTHDMRIGYYTDTYRRTADGWRLHTRSMTFLRKSGARDCGTAARPDPARAHGPLMELDEFRASLDAWLEEHAADLRPRPGAAETLDEQMAQLAKVKRLTYDAGWMRWGWPERVGGLGGSTLLRAYLGEALTARDLVEPGIYSMTEVLAPTMIDYATPELAADMVPRLLRGDETWCQGFSEPGTGSNLAALSCRATRAGDGWRVTGQKVWTSLAQYAERCVLLTRTGVAGVGPPGHHRPLRRHGQPGHHGAAHRDHARRPRVLRGLLRRRRRALRPHPRRARARAGRWPWTCSPSSGAPRSGIAPPTSTDACRTSSTPSRRTALDPADGGRGAPAALRPAGPVAGHPAPAGRRRAPGPGDLRRQGAGGHGRTGRVRPRGRRAGPRAGRRRRPGQRPVAARVPLLAGGHHLRRDGGDPAQHHRPPAARPRDRTADGRRRPGAVRARASATPAET